MSLHILITGGAGFIGSHLADTLLAHGHRVRVLDNLTPQVHGDVAARPEYLSPDVEFIHGDVRNAATVRHALRHIDAVYHFAAAVGVGQSMYEIAHYMDVNTGGTAVLLEALSARPVQRLIVASSMSIYGEGLCRTPDGRPALAEERTPARLQAGEWEPRDGEGTPLTPMATPEEKSPSLASIYALSKYDQERMCLIIGKTYGIPTTALRFFNVYGPRQALSNPYTGVLAIFASRLLNGNPPLLFEDGLQRRDFVSVYDVAEACRRVLDRPASAGLALNIGSGTSHTIRDIAARLTRLLGRDEIKAEITGRYRAGDIRHCFADITQARAILGYTPARTLDDGLEELAGWLAHAPATDRVQEASDELAARGLTV